MHHLLLNIILSIV